MSVENIENLVEFPPFVIPAEHYRGSEPRALAILLPAMGTTAGFYGPFAAALADLGFDVLLPELPGTGKSRPRPSWSVDYGYRELAGRYLKDIAARARTLADGKTVMVIGHSLGAHTAALGAAMDAVDIDALVTVAGGNIHYRNWRGMGSIKVYTAAQLFRALTYLFGHLPGQYVGFGGPQARTLLRQWSKIIRSGRFDHIADGLHAPRLPALCIGFQGDEFAPAASVEGLADWLQAETVMLQRDWPGNPHSSWARHPDATVACIDGWFRRQGF